MNLYLVGIVSLFSVVLLTLVGLFLYPKLNWMDKPKLYGHNREPVPYSFGLVLFIAFVVTGFWFLGLDPRWLSLFVAAALLVLVSFLDDRYKLSPVLRFGVQIVCACIVVSSGAQVMEISNPFGEANFELGAIAYVFTVFWIVALTNLVNFLDGVSGLSSGVSAIGFWVLFGLSIWPDVHFMDQTLVSVLALSMAIAASCAAIFEFPKPKFLIGDSGSMFFGFMLGALSVANGGKLATILLVLLIPILDGAWVIFRRLYNKQKPWTGDLLHFHHRLLDIGFSERKLLIIYYILSAAFGLIALFVWNTFFKVVSLLILFSGFVLTGYYVWIQGKK
jgi:UDP-GlcNAc:undecaprenyl-phosphate GlcNAc-1-phosphate transferase